MLEDKLQSTERPGFREKERPPAQNPTSEADKFYTTRAETRGPAISIEFEMEEIELGLSYSDLLTAIHYRPKGILLQFRNMDVVIEGRNLKALFSAVLKHAVSRIWIQKEGQIVEENALCVVSIAQYMGEEREKWEQAFKLRKEGA